MNDESISMHDLLQRLSALEKVSSEEQQQIVEVIESRDSIVMSPDLTAEAELSPTPRAEPKPDGDEQLYSRISKMLLPEKVKLALLGNATCRALLIRDANRMIQAFVLKNPRIQANEVEEFARNPNLSEFVIRTIADNQAWTKNYNMKLNLVMNPKAPLEISLKFLRYLNLYDVRRIAKSKNLPQTLTVAARKKVSENQQK